MPADPALFEKRAGWLGAFGRRGGSQMAELRFGAYQYQNLPLKVLQWR
jgi:hypothetical protein